VGPGGAAKEERGAQVDPVDEICGEKIG